MNVAAYLGGGSGSGDTHVSTVMSGGGKVKKATKAAKSAGGVKKATVKKAAKGTVKVTGKGK